MHHCLNVHSDMCTHHADLDSSLHGVLLVPVTAVYIPNLNVAAQSNTLSLLHILAAQCSTFWHRGSLCMPDATGSLELAKRFPCCYHQHWRTCVFVLHTQWAAVLLFYVQGIGSPGCSLVRKDCKLRIAVDSLPATSMQHNLRWYHCN